MDIDSFIVAFVYAIRMIQANQKGLKLNATLQLLVYADVVNILGRSIQTVKKTQKHYNIKYQNDIRWVTHPPDIILIFDIVIAHNGDEPLKDRSINCC